MTRSLIKSGTSVNNLASFITQVNNQFSLNLTTYEDLHAWSISYSKEFYESLGRATGLAATHANYADAIFTDKRGASEAITCLSSDRTVTFTKLKESVDSLASFLEQHLTVARIQNRDDNDKLTHSIKSSLVAVCLPNILEAAIAALASSAIGAPVTICAPEYGLGPLVDRFKNAQILITKRTYQYKDKTFDISDNLTALINACHFKTVIFIDDPLNLAYAYSWAEILQHKVFLAYESFPADHPLFLLFSSGTTGKPKGLIHSLEGTLLNHQKEHYLHNDLKAGDSLFFYTSSAWMMWQWQLSALALGIKIYLYSDNIAGTLKPFEFARTHNITALGFSSSYLNNLAKDHTSLPELNSTKLVMTTGSPLFPRSYKYFQNQLPHIRLASISGGTDIVGCFLIGNPLSPNNKALGADVAVADEDNQRLSNSYGELACFNELPNFPRFLDDPDNKRLQATYFQEGVWHHGDLAIETDNFITIHGRYDDVLNAGGIRFGASEMYDSLVKLPGVSDSLLVSKKSDLGSESEEELVLFIQKNSELTVSEVKAFIRANLSPRHVPKHILWCTDIPRTATGKKSERIVNNLLNNRPVSPESLANPECLAEYQTLIAKLFS